METRSTSPVLLRMICCLVLMAGTVFFLPSQAPVFGQSSKKIVPSESLQRAGTCFSGDDDGDLICNDDDNCVNVHNNGQEDTDGDGAGDACDTDDDDDGVEDDFDNDPTNQFSCEDADGDGCDDCSQSGFQDPDFDGADWDFDGLCDLGDNDDDNDGVEDSFDTNPYDDFSCEDSDGDGCDDCSQSGFPDPFNDGSDWDGDGLCDDGDDDDDNDGVEDSFDTNPYDDFNCEDSDGDGCDDCSQSGFPDPNNDGPDWDGDGLCDDGDDDDDNDGVEDSFDTNPYDWFICEDSDNDGCDDCSQGYGYADQLNDGSDWDGDGLCDDGDDDDDNDGVLDIDDSQPLDHTVCQDLDNDGCDDCSQGYGYTDQLNDGSDWDGDGLCDNGDDDDDNDGVPDIDDSQPLDQIVCQDLDNDGCDDCSQGLGYPDANADGPDDDSDGVCNFSDVCDGDDTSFDNDGDGICNDIDPCDYAVDGIENFDEENCHCDLGYYAVYTIGEVLNGQTTRGVVPVIILGCQQCEPGYYCPDGYNAYPCPAGKYGDLPGMIVCNDCDEGFGSFEGAIECTEIIECEVSEWSEWSECASLGGCFGLRSRTREIISMPNAFGAPCPALSEFEICDPCATCDDEIMNGFETGVDCGGPDCPACGTCEDGIKNGNELGIDCGGPNCLPCNPPDATCGVITVYVDPMSFSYDGPGSQNIWLIPGIDLDAGSTSDDVDPILEVKRYLSNITFNWTTNGACIDEMPNGTINNPDKGIVYRDCYPAIPADVNKNKLYRLKITDDFGSDECTGTVKVVHYTPTSATPISSVHFVIPDDDEYISMKRPQVQIANADLRTVHDLVAIPNPGSDLLRLSWNADTEGEVTIRIVDIAGRLVVSQEYAVIGGQNSVTFDMHAQPAGIYVILVQSKDEVINTKWVKE